MKWGRRKSHELSLHHIFFFSWAPKLKQMGMKKPRFRSATAMQKTTPKPPESPSPVCFRRSLHFQPGHGFHVSSVPDCYASFQGLDIADPPISPQILSERADKDLLIDEPGNTILPLSLGKQSSAWGRAENFPEDCPEFQFLNDRDCRWNDKLLRKGLGRKLQESRKFSDMVSGIRKMKLQENEKAVYAEDQQPKEFKMPPPIIVRESEWTKPGRRTSKEEQMSHYKGALKWKQKMLDPASRNAVALDSRKPHQINKISLDSRKPHQRVGDEPATSLKSIQRSMKYEMARVLAGGEEKKRIEEAKSPHRDGYLQRRKSGPKSRTGVPTPRAASRSEICKVKALENLKKARKKRETEKRRAFDSFAVVKHSFNPHQDFRDSMIEMILEHAIGQPEELENLLACYLSLNSDKYHDTIVKVFGEVWFDLNRPWVSQVENG
ncbi:hypothetical protein ACLOJK_010689 [Asimina triloba]